MVRIKSQSRKKLVNINHSEVQFFLPGRTPAEWPLSRDLLRNKVNVSWHRGWRGHQVMNF